MSALKTENQSLFIKSDPITFILRGRYKLRPGLATIIFFLIANIPILITSIANGILYSRGQRIGLLEDFGWWTYQFGSFPASFYLLMWLPDGIEQVLDGLKCNGVINISNSSRGKKNWDNFKGKFARSYSSWIWMTISIALITLFMLFFFLPRQKDYYTWQSASSFAYWYVIAYWCFVAIVAALLVTKMIITVVWFNLLFHEFSVVVKLLDSDKAGGLSPLGKFTTNIGYTLGICGVALVIGNYSEARLLRGDFVAILTQSYVIIVWSIYLALILSIFFFPLLTAHFAMVKAKNEYLDYVSNLFNRELEVFKTKLNSDKKISKTAFERIGELEKLPNIVSNYPTWPFNTSIFTRFFSSTLIPFILAFMPALLEKLLK